MQSCFTAESTIANNLCYAHLPVSFVYDPAAHATQDEEPVYTNTTRATMQSETPKDNNYRNASDEWKGSVAGVSRPNSV